MARVITEDENPAHSNDNKFHLDKAGRALKEAKALHNKYVTKMIPLENGKGFRYKKIRLKKQK